MIDEILKNLNEKQLEAVKTSEGYVRVIAGAGSGKTKTLTSRYAYIVEALGINSSNILCVTFTNKAAQEMRKRVKKLVGENTDLSLITTYHGFCVKVLREDMNRIGYPKNFLIIDVEDQKTILREVYNELGLTAKDHTFKQSLRFISERKQEGDYLSYVLESEKTNNSEVPKNPFLEPVFSKYLEKQRRNFALDFDDLLNFTLYIFDKFPDVLSKWQQRLHYIQVDETQDSSLNQFSLVEMLSDYHKNLFIVGDPDQTIYEWRGARPEILVNFDKQHPDSKTIVMNQNYRSTQNILNLGNHIIKNNKIRVDKDMFTQNEKGVEVVHFHGQNDFEEGLWIAKEIKNLINEQNVKYSDFAILYRANHVSRIIEQSFIRENIPYTIFGGIRFFERKEIKDIISYLRLVVLGDDLSFLRVINTPTRGLGKKFIEDISKIAENNNQTLLETLQKNTFDRKGAIEFVQLINKFEQRKDEIKVSDLIKEILDETGLYEFYRTDGDTDRLENIKELQNSIISLENDDAEKLTLENYLQEVALYTDMDVDDGKNDKVKLMTIHTSKGLEFPYVFLSGFTEGVLPNYTAIKEKRLEEERRLAHVAITRAEKAFYMTESEGFNFQTGMNKYPSRFLFEIEDQFYVRQGTLSPELIEEAKLQIKLQASILNRTVQNFQIGDLVTHTIFKQGKVLEVNLEQKEYQIEFFEIQKVKPIKFEFQGLTKLKEKIELTEEEKLEKEKSDEDWELYLKELNNPFQ